MRSDWRPGGHYQITHTDVGSLRWMTEDLGVQSMVDVGCGPGGQVRLARQFGIYARGIDADRTVCDGDFVQYGKVGQTTEGETAAAVIYVDAVWSIECAEHVAASDAIRYVQYMQECAARYIFMTSNPNPGPYHANPQPSEYWIDLMSKGNRWRHDAELTQEWKTQSSMTREFIQATGLAFTCA